MAIISKSALEWSALPNYILAEGDTGFETDTCSRKIGDGITKWVDLEYEELILHRRDRKSNWLTKDPILGDGEMVLETDTKRHKIGDGKKRYSQLDYGDNTVMQLLNMVMPPEYNLTSIGSGGIQQGGLSDQGEEVACDYIIRTPIMDLTTVDGLLSSVNEGWLQQVYIYDHENNFLAHNGWQVAPIDIVCENRKVRLAFKKFDHPDISIEDYENCGNNLRSKKLIPRRSQAATKKNLEEFIRTLNSIIGNNEDLITVEKVLVDAINGLKTDTEKLQTAIEVTEIANLCELDDFAPAEGHRFFALNIAGTETAYLMQTVYNGIATQMLWTSRIIEGNTFTSQQSDEGMCVYTRVKKEDGWGEWNEAGGSGSGAGNVFNVDKFVPLSEGNYTLATAVEAVKAYKNGKFMCPGLVITFKGSDNTFKTYQFHSDTVEDIDEISLWAPYGGQDRVKEIVLNGETLTPNSSGRLEMTIPIVTVDETLDEESTNAAQSGVVAKELKDVKNKTLQTVEAEEVDNGVELRFLNATNEEITAVTIPAVGGGGGGDSSTTRIVLSAVLSADVIKVGDAVTLSYTYNHQYSSGEDKGQPTGAKADLVIQVKYGSEVLHETQINGVSAGTYTYPLPKDLPAGVIDTYVIATTNDPLTGTAQKRQAYASVRAIEITLNSSFDLLKNVENGGFSGMVTIPFAISGVGTKVVKLLLNGVEYASQTVTASGVTNSNFQVNLGDSKYYAGRHNVQMVAEVQPSQGVTIKSNSIYIDLLKAGYTKPFVGIKHSFSDGRTFNTTTYRTPTIPFKQYDKAELQYVVYDKDNVTVGMVITQDGEQVLSTTAGRQVYTYTNRYTAVGSYALSFVAGTTTYSYTAVVGKADTDIDEVTNGLELKLVAAGRSNSENNPAQWTYKDVKTEFFGFDWGTNGWIDNKLVLNNGASINVGYKPFATEAMANGKTIELELKTSDIFDKDGVILSCMKDGVGFQMTTREAKLVTKGNKVLSTMFAPDIDLRISFIVESRNDNRLLFMYVNGICCGSVQYDQSDSLMHTTPAESITINSNPCDVAITSIRSYSLALSDDDIIKNYIADRADNEEMSKIFQRNDVLDDNGKSIDINKLKAQGKAVMIFRGAVDKVNEVNDKKFEEKCDFEFWDERGNHIVATNFGLRIQGTSSTLYPRKNYRIYLGRKSEYGTTLSINGDNIEDLSYALRDNARPVRIFCLKADFAESSGTHNTGVARIVNDIWREANFLTPAQKANKDEYDVRIGIDGFPISLFYEKNGETIFMGHYNFNNEKSESAIVYGFEGIAGFNDEETLAGNPNPCMCLEFLNNTHQLGRFLSDDISAFDEALEFRYPDQKWKAATDVQKAAIQRLWSWVYSCKNNPDKFVKEYMQYFDKKSLLGWYLFTEYFMAVDQRVKNMMLATWDGNIWHFLPYDCDTILGVRNDGQLKYDYTLDENTFDEETNEYAYMGSDSVLWDLVRENLSADLSSVATEIRGKMSNEDVLKVLNEEQMGAWSERVYNKDSDWKYIKPITEGITDSEGKTAFYNYLYSLQGSRYAHRTYIVRNRFALMDAKYVAGEYRKDAVTCYFGYDFSQDPRIMKVTAAEPFYFGYGYTNGSPTQSALKAEGEDSVVTMTVADTLKVNDPQNIYGASKMKVLDLSNIASKLVGQINLSKCRNVQKIDLSCISDTTEEINSAINGVVIGDCINLMDINVNGMMSTAFNTLDLSKCRKLKTVIAGKTLLTGITFAKGVKLVKAVLPSTLQAFELKNSTTQTGAIQIISEDSDNGYGNITRLVLESCPSFDWITWIQNCTSLQFMRVTDIYTYGNGDILTEIYRRNIGGVDGLGNNVIGKCYLTGTYQLTKEMDENELRILSDFFSDLNILQPQYTTLEFEKSIIASDNISNLDNATGSKYGNDYKYSGAVKAILDSRKTVLGKYNPVTNKVVVCALDDNDRNKFWDGSPADLTGAMGDVYMYEPSYWYKGVDIDSNFKQYQFYAFTEDSPKSTTKYNFFKGIESIDDTLQAYSVRLPEIGTKIDVKSPISSNGMNTANNNHRIIRSILKDGYEYIKYIRWGYGNFFTTDEDGVVLQVGTFNMPLTTHYRYGVKKLEKGSRYIYYDAPGGIDPDISYITQIQCEDVNYIESMEPDWVKHQECLIGVYKSTLKRGIISSVSGEQIVTGISPDSIEYQNYLKAKGNYFCAVPYSEYKCIANLYIAKYGIRKFQDIVGTALTNESSCITGKTDNMGMRDSTTQDGLHIPMNNTTQLPYSNAMGYEAIASVAPEYIYKANNWGGIKSYDPRTNTERVLSNGSYSADLVDPYLTTVYNGKYMDITPIDSNYYSLSSNDNYRSALNHIYYSSLSYLGSFGCDTEKCSIFSFNKVSSEIANSISSMLATRLMFYGTIEWAKSVEEFKKL